MGFYIRVSWLFTLIVLVSLQTFATNLFIVEADLQNSSNERVFARFKQVYRITTLGISLSGDFNYGVRISFEPMGDPVISYVGGESSKASSAALKKFIEEDLGLKWYTAPLRQDLNVFQLAEALIKQIDRSPAPVTYTPTYRLSKNEEG